jgi:hypothetical protein
MDVDQNVNARREPIDTGTPFNPVAPEAGASPVTGERDYSVLNGSREEQERNRQADVADKQYSMTEGHPSEEGQRLMNEANDRKYSMLSGSAADQMAAAQAMPAIPRDVTDINAAGNTDLSDVNAAQPENIEFGSKEDKEYSIMDGPKTLRGDKTRAGTVRRLKSVGAKLGRANKKLSFLKGKEQLYATQEAIKVAESRLKMIENGRRAAQGLPPKVRKHRRKPKEDFL